MTFFSIKKKTLHLLTILMNELLMIQLKQSFTEQERLLNAK